MIKVKFLPANKVVEVPAGNTILQAAAAAGVQVESTCGGKGTCGKCLVQLTKDDLTPPSTIEKKFLSDAQLKAGWVLACQRPLEKDLVVKLQEQKDAFDRKIALNKDAKITEIAPSVHKHFLTVPKPSTEDQISDWERLLTVLPDSKIKFNRLVATALPKILRESKFQVTAVLEGEDLLAVEPGDTTSRSYGLAVDIGTTTAVAYLMDLKSGELLASGGVTNPQNAYGADVIARITHAALGTKELQQLQKKVVSGLNEIIALLCERARVAPEEIYQVVVVGNTTMSHLFLGIDPTYLAPAPFIPAFRQAVEVEARELGLKILSTAKVVMLPNVAGYVGSDTVGVMLSAEVDKLQGINLIVDIGTNGELVLAGKDRILSCSTAAGPAFEGAEIKHGMRAADGAIEGVTIDEDVQLAVIGDTQAQGICGSGLIDAIAQMFKAGVIDATGRLAVTPERQEKLPPLVRQRLRESEQGMEFVLAWAKDTATEEDIVLTQKDIRELQLAKGAILTGARILLKELGVGVEDLDQVLLAGAFGSYIKKESALEIGLLPSVELERVKTIGNAAGDGAKRALLSEAELTRAETLARRSEHVELSTRKEFQEEFMLSLTFGKSM